jgi:ferredoxin
MPTITYVEFGGREHRVEVPVGSSVMRGAVNNNIPGVDADCGGECACATCHVYVDEGWLAKTGTPATDSQEASMLSFRGAGTAQLPPLLPDHGERRAGRVDRPSARRATLKSPDRRTTQ